jgi:tRNA (guanine-N7-)-methyltransferase
MVATGMKRYRVRTAQQSWYVGDDNQDRLDPMLLFGRQAPWRLDVGFGHGEFLSQMAAAHPDEDFIGVEHNDLRVTKTAHKSHDLDARNVRLFRNGAHAFVRRRLPPASLHRAYVLFPDPWPRRRHRRRRLLNRSFLCDLAWSMVPGGRLVLASDAHDYVMQALSNVSTLPGLWFNRYQPRGYTFDIPTRFPTVFERHKKREGHRIAYLLFERSVLPAPERLPFLHPHGDES